MTWHPVASSSDLAYRTTYHAQILGRELVAWRADDDTVNLWENRCLHRGVRLTQGINDGAELVCRYHGWRYANQTAGCTYIPAHPADAPARTICNQTYPVTERYGLVWGSTTAEGEVPDLAPLTTGTPFPLRPIPVNAPPEAVMAALETYRFLPSAGIESPRAAPGDWRTFRSDADDWDISVTDRGDHHVTIRAVANGDESSAVFWVQPVDAHRAVIRGVLAAEPDPDARLDVWRHHSVRLSRLRDDVEARAALEPMPEPIVVEITPVSVELTGLPEARPGRNAPLRVRVARKWETASGIAAFELAPVDGRLLTFQPGAHIDVHLPNGLVRQYSLTNGPGELSAYRIGVKLEPEGEGGSRLLHETVREGDVLAISPPRNSFTLRRDSERTVLLAGGIGVTPLLAMAQTLERGGLHFELHLFAQGASFLPFADVRATLAESTVEHLGLSPVATGDAIRSILGEHTESAQVYVCGPGPMIEATVDIAAELGWPDAAVHYEYFANANEIDDSSAFEVALARSAISFEVAAGQTILEALRDHDIDLPSSCEQGACGTCVAPVLEGDPLHQDVCLNRSERAAGDRIVTCVSRATSERLVLDL